MREPASSTCGMSKSVRASQLVALVVRGHTYSSTASPLQRQPHSSSTRRTDRGYYRERARKRERENERARGGAEREREKESERDAH